jgi:purine-binding chemotaxis protein CheW
MTTRASKQRASGTALLEEVILDERAPDKQPDVAEVEEAGEENRLDERASGKQPDRAAAKEVGDEDQLDEREPNAQQGIQQFVTFMAGDEVFAADMAPVQEIIRVPEVVRVPLAPSALEGLANLRGKVLPIISLRRLFGFPEIAHDDSTRALVVDVGQPLGFVVDRAISKMWENSAPQ